MSAASAVTLLDRFTGCILGLAAGDAVAAPFEGMPATAIWYDFGGADKIIASPPNEVLCYTDDTQMMIAVAETLCTCGNIDETVLVQEFARRFDPERGYGPGARRIVEAMRDGTDWRQLARTILPGGSLGNGAAMRVAPVGLFFHHDAELVAQQAILSAIPTHLHPVGQDAAVILALAVAWVVREGNYSHDRFYQHLIGNAATDEMRSQLEWAAALTPTDTVAGLGNRLEAHYSVATAIACFTMSPNSYSHTIGTALTLGGDTDTLAAMSGALAGAYLGLPAVPPHLLARLERGPEGCDYLHSLAHHLHTRYCAPT